MVFDVLCNQFYFSSCNKKIQNNKCVLHYLTYKQKHNQKEKVKTTFDHMQKTEKDSTFII